MSATHSPLVTKTGIKQNKNAVKSREIVDEYRSKTRDSSAARQRMTRIGLGQSQDCTSTSLMLQLCSQGSKQRGICVLRMLCIARRQPSDLCNAAAPNDLFHNAG